MTRSSQRTGSSRTSSSSTGPGATPAPATPLTAIPPRGGERLSEADWKQALAGAKTPDWLDRALIRQGHSPRSALAWLRRHLVALKDVGGHLVIHSHWPDVPAL